VSLESVTSPFILNVPIYEGKVGLKMYLRPEILAKVGFSIDISDRGFSSSSIKLDISYSTVSFSLTFIF
jgi:hypothetical protein